MAFGDEVEQLALLLKLAAEDTMDVTLDQLRAAWSVAWDEIAQEWREALTELAAVAEDGLWPSRAQILRNARAQKALRAAAAALDDLAGQAPGIVSGNLPEILQQAAAASAQVVGAQLPADFDVPVTRFDPDALQAMVARTTQQITARAWPVAAETEAAIRSALIRGVAVGENPRDAAARMLDRVQGRFEGGRARAENIARTEMIDAHRAAAKTQQDASADVLAGWRWTATLNDRTCPSCIAQHGTVYPLEQEGPWDHPSGRCARVPVTKSWADLGIDVPEFDTPPHPQVRNGSTSNPRRCSSESWARPGMRRGSAATTRRRRGQSSGTIPNGGPATDCPPPLADRGCWSGT